MRGFSRIKTGTRAWQWGGGSIAEVQWAATYTWVLRKKGDQSCGERAKPRWPRECELRTGL